MRQWFKKYMDWAISSQGLKRTRFNDYPVREYTASDWRWKWYAPAWQGEDIVWTSVKAEDAFWRCDSKTNKK